MKAQITFLSGARSGQVETFQKGYVELGRHPLSDLRFDPDGDLDVSSQHAAIIRQGGAFLVRDLGSKNGTFVNGIRAVGDAPLRDGDVIGFGTHGPSLEFHVLEADTTRRRIARRTRVGRADVGPARQVSRGAGAGPDPGRAQQPRRPHRGRSRAPDPGAPPHHQGAPHPAGGKRRRLRVGAVEECAQCRPNGRASGPGRLPEPGSAAAPVRLPNRAAEHAHRAPGIAV